MIGGKRVSLSEPASRLEAIYRFTVDDDGIGDGSDTLHDPLSTYGRYSHLIQKPEKEVPVDFIVSFEHINLRAAK